jgi:hypothetical protein
VVWVVAGRADGPRDTVLTLSEEATGVSVKTLAWPASVPNVAGLGSLPLEILGVRLEVATTSTSGARRQVIEIADAAVDLLALISAGSTTAPSSSGVVEFSAGFHETDGTTELAGSVARSALPLGTALQPGQIATIIQDPLVDTADTVIVHVRARVRRSRSAI